jgi:DNA-binding MarR family transcriptional regulator
MSSEISRREQLLEELANSVRANQRATDVVDELASQLLGVNRTDSRCMDILDQHAPMTAGELARASNLTTGAITAVIDRLERAGYARRVADPSDRRRVLIEPTEKMKQAAWELFGQIYEDASPLMDPYSNEQIELLIEFNRFGRELQERNAERLRARLRDRGTTSA